MIPPEPEATIDSTDTQHWVEQIADPEMSRAGDYPGCTTSGMRDRSSFDCEPRVLHYESILIT